MLQKNLNQFNLIGSYRINLLFFFLIILSPFFIEINFFFFDFSKNLPLSIFILSPILLISFFREKFYQNKLIMISLILFLINISASLILYGAYKVISSRFFYVNATIIFFLCLIEYFKFFFKKNETKKKSIRKILIFSFISIVYFVYFFYVINEGTNSFYLFAKSHPINNILNFLHGSYQYFFVFHLITLALLVDELFFKKNNVQYTIFYVFTLFVCFQQLYFFKSLTGLYVAILLIILSIFKFYLLKINKKKFNELYFKNERKFFLIFLFSLSIFIFIFIQLGYFKILNLSFHETLHKREYLFIIFLDSLTYKSIVLPFLNENIFIHSISVSYHNGFLEILNYCGIGIFLIFIYTIVSLIKSSDINNFNINLSLLLIIFLSDHTVTTTSFLYTVVIYSLIYGFVYSVKSK